MTVIHVQWLDSETQDGWVKLEDLVATLEITHTVGFLVHESDHFLIVAHSHDPATDSNNGLMTIPKAAIKVKRTVCRIKT